MNQKGGVNNGGQENRRPLLHRVFGISSKGGASASALAGGTNSNSMGATSRVVT
jgi:hypothetical protein